MMTKVIFTVGITFAVSSCLADEPKQKDGGEKPNRIFYTVADEWEINSNGVGKVIIIDKKNRNQKDLLQLGDQLQEHYRDQKDCHFYIFDDKRAADMKIKKTYDKLPPKSKEAQFYDKHLIGFYTKNSTTGNHKYWFGIANNGHQGKTTTVDYKTGEVTRDK